ncbi:Adenine/guanine phosphoribosyltransferase-related PRPP-binding protein [Thermoplasmatales archaeon BRNA1]|nr:Adenine/guanine phosphoribosyltransferase-related PRPP-binding protein [Thermoplasmatales archaeon BRNA1]
MYELLVSSIEASPVVDRNGYPYFVHPLTDGVPKMDPAVLKEVISWIEDVSDLECDVIAAPEAMGIPLAIPVSLDKGIPYSVIRKKKYGLPGEVEIEQNTGYSKSVMHIDGINMGDRVVIIDDVVSTGGTLIALIRALRDEIGAEIVDVVIPVDKKGGADIVERETGIRVKTLVNVYVDDDRKVHCELVGN